MSNDTSEDDDELSEKLRFIRGQRTHGTIKALSVAFHRDALADITLISQKMGHISLGHTVRYLVAIGLACWMPNLERLKGEIDHAAE